MRLNLGSYLQQHGITAYRLVKEVEGRVAPNTVYSLARRPAQRIDLDTVEEVLQALGRLTGEEVTLTEIVGKLPESPQNPVNPGSPVSLTEKLEVPLYDPKNAKVFRPSGKLFKVKPGGLSIEQMVAEDRGRSYP